MSWNYRLVRIKYPKSTVYSEEQVLEIKEIYYDKDGNINGYGDAPVPYGETVDNVKECLDLMYEALNKPIIDLCDIENRSNEKESPCKDCANYNTGDGIDDIEKCQVCKFS